MGMTRVAVPLDRRVLRRVDRLVAQGDFPSRGDAIAAVITETLKPGRTGLTPADVLEIVRRGREEFRNGRARIIRSSAELR
jgi:metal-responsive CopG/Arc/MetJ family transcriptional regulator